MSLISTAAHTFFVKFNGWGFYMRKTGYFCQGRIVAISIGNLIFCAGEWRENEFFGKGFR